MGESDQTPHGEVMSNRCRGLREVWDRHMERLVVAIMTISFLRFRADREGSSLAGKDSAGSQAYPSIMLGDLRLLGQLEVR